MFFLHLLLSSAVMSIVVLFLAVTSEIFPNAVKASHRYAAWVFVLIGFLLPLRPVVGGGLINLALPSNNQAIPPPEAVLQPQNVFVGEAILPAAISVYNVVLLVWLGGMLFFLAYYVLKHIRFMRIVKRWSLDVTDEAWLSLLAKVRDENGIGQIGLKKCSFVSTSMLVGFFKPLVLLPDKEFDAYELELIFRHELVHHRRKDLFVKLLSMLAVSIHWFNPAAYIMSAQMQADCEASCDERVLARAGDSEKLSYAELIIEMIGTKRQFASSLSTCFYGSKRSIKKRMNAIMEPSAKIGKLRFLVVLPVLVVTFFSGSVFAFSEQEFVPLPMNEPLFDETIMTLDEAVKISNQVIEGGLVIGVSVNEEQNTFLLEVIRGSNKYFLTIRSDGSVTLDQTISIFEPDTQIHQESHRHNRRGRMWQD